MTLLMKQKTLVTGLNGDSAARTIENVPVTRISDAVRRYKVGITEDPWKN